MHIDSYLTVKDFAKAEYIVKKSKFIGTIMPVKNVDEANEFISSVSKQYWDATHNVFAYILRDNGIKKFSDDGEPQGTAGKPCLDVLEKSNLTDCAVVITRYFGGIMLGAGGLVRAYSHSTALAVEEGKIIKRALCCHMVVKCDYGFYGKLNSLIPENNGVIEDTVFDSEVSVYFRLEQSICQSFNDKLIDISNGKYSAVIINKSFEDI